MASLEIEGAGGCGHLAGVVRDGLLEDRALGLFDEDAERHAGAEEAGGLRGGATGETRLHIVRGDDVVGREDDEALDQVCLLYTSDAADERSSVDLGGR